MKKYLFALLLLFSTAIFPVNSQSLYFPPLTGTNWDTVSFSAQGWNSIARDTLYQFLEQKHTKAFLILKDGKIIMEKYFGAFERDSIWYWASAAKTLTAFLVGKAQEDGYLSISDTTSKYLGAHWTAAPLLKENKITIRHQLTMTTGLDDGVQDDHCTLDTCLQYLADAGSRWAYHNAAYTLLSNVLEVATNKTLNLYTLQNLNVKTGMSGLWFKVNYDQTFYSTARTMARFGLLILNKGVWNTDTLLHDQNYFQQMTQTSQNINNSYGYLWWLNGKGSYMLPQSQFEFFTDLIPPAPDDLIAALGKNDQKLYVVPSQKLVVVRMGDASGSSLYALSSFDSELWTRLNAVMNTSTVEENQISKIAVFPNPSSDYIEIKDIDFRVRSFAIMDITGRVLRNDLCNQSKIAVNELDNGIYVVLLYNKEGEKIYTAKCTVLRK